MALPTRPASRDDFRIAILCALSKEAEMVERVLDRTYTKEEAHGKAFGDTNTYTTGAISRHNVVLAYCPDMGGSAAAAAATHLKHSFPRLEITLVVGICGVAPFYKNELGTQEIVLGDCVISTALVQLDFGRIGPSGFSRKDSLSAPGRAGASIRSLLAKLRAHQPSLETDLGHCLSSLQNDQTLSFPGKQQDCLYESDYIHTHSPPCIKCNSKLGLCEHGCDDIGCLSSRLLQRSREATSPRIHFGTFGSSNAVIKSGLARDAHTKEDEIIAFEMEGCGVWDVSPAIIIKAACDYADSHKNKKWQRYSSAVAASALKAVLGQVELSDPPVIRSCTLGTMQDAISQADAAIRRYYISSNRLHIERLSGLKLPLDKCYINLALAERPGQGKGSKDSFTLESRLQLDAKAIGRSVSIDKLFDRQILSSGLNGLPRRIFIQGRAGVGKTTLCKKLVYEFLQERLGSGLFDRLLWIPLRRLNKQKAGNWRNILQSAYALQDPIWRQNCESYVDQFYDPGFLDRTLLLFDGLDEISSGWRQDHEFYEFLSSIICDSPNIIITSRPQAKTFDSGTFDMELETVGFSDEQVDAYMQNCIEHKDTIQDMKEFLNSRPLVQSLLRIPIQLDAFCMIWPSEEIPEGDNPHLTTSKKSGDPTVLEVNSINTMTTLYNTISLELCRKDLGLRQLQPPYRGMSDFEVEQSMANELTFLGELAFQGLWGNIIEYYPKHWNAIGLHASTQLPTPYSATLDRLSFLRSSDSTKQDPSKRNYHFLHLTFQEFFAARHFVDHWAHDKSISCLRLRPETEARTRSPLQLIQLEKYNPRYNIFWRFVTGLIQLHAESSPALDISSQQSSVSLFFRQLEGRPIEMFENTHYELLMHCLSEISITDDRSTKELRQRLESVMLQNFGTLAKQPEFPESVLLQKLKEGQLSTQELPIDMIPSRAHFSPTLVKAVIPYLDTAFPLRTRCVTAMIVCRHWRGDSTELIQCITPLCLDLGKVKNLPKLPLHRQMFEFCGSGETYEAILSVLRNENKVIDFRRGMGYLLCFASPPLVHLGTFITIITDSREDKFIRLYAAKLLNHSRVQLDESKIGALISMLWSGDDLDLRLRAARIVQSQELPIHSVPSIVELLNDKGQGDGLRSCALQSLSSALSTNELLTTTISLIVDGDGDCFRDTLPFLWFDFPVSINERNAEGLVTIFQDESKDNHECFRAWAYSILLSCINLSRNSLIAMIRPIEQGERKFLPHVKSLLWYRRRLSLPDAIGDALLRAMTSTNVEVQKAAFQFDWWGELILPETVVRAVMQWIRSRNSLIGFRLLECMSGQPCVSGEEFLFLASLARGRNDLAHMLSVFLDKQSHAADFFLRMADTELRNWKNLYSLLKDRSYGGIYTSTCYEYEGFLHMSYAGSNYQLTTTSASTERLLKAIKEIGDQADYFEAPEGFKNDQNDEDSETESGEDDSDKEDKIGLLK